MPLRVMGFVLVILGALTAVAAVVAGIWLAGDEEAFSMPALVAGLALAIFLEIAGALLFHIGMRAKRREHPGDKPGPMA